MAAIRAAARASRRVDGEGADGELGSVVTEALAEGEDGEEGDERRDQHDPGRVGPEPAVPDGGDLSSSEHE